MNLNELEIMRKKEIAKFFLFLISNTVLFVILIWFELSYCEKVNNLLALIDAVLVILYGYIGFMPKEFEVKIKKDIMPLLLKNILVPDADIKWAYDNYTPFVEITPDRGDIAAVEKEIDRRFCVKYPGKHIDSEKLMNYASAIKNLKEQNKLTPEQMQLLKSYQEYINEYQKKLKIIAKAKHEIACRMLEELQEKGDNINEYDKRKIEYLKLKNENYKESIVVKKYSDELESLRQKKEDELNSEEKSRIEFLQQKINEYHEKTLKEIKNQQTEIFAFTASLNSALYKTLGVPKVDDDDKFYGTYKGIKFAAFEINDCRLFYGTMIAIPLKSEFKNDVSIIYNGKNGLKSELKNRIKLNKQRVNFGNFLNHTLWAKSIKNISDVITEKFIGYVNSLPGNFSFLINGDYAYLIYPHKKDLYRYGSLFKKLNDRKQYEELRKDIITLLNIVEQFGNAAA